MAAKRPNRTTIVIAPEVRDGLKHIARKDQSYNALLIDLIKLHQDHIQKTVQVGRGEPNQPPENLTQNQSRCRHSPSDHEPSGVSDYGC